MTAYVIVDIEVTDPETYEEYKKLAAPTVSQYDGRYVVRGGVAEKLEGDQDPHRVVVLEFPSMERAREWWGSPEYSKARAIRNRSANSRMILVAGT